MSDAMDLWEACLPYWHAFLQLHRSRQIAIGATAAVPLPLAYTEMAAYARDHGLADDQWDLDETLALLIQLDQTYLEHAAERRQGT